VARKFPRNALCPCGSGKKYKKCCIDKGFDWVETDDGAIAKRVPLSDEAMTFFDELRQAQIERFGYLPDRVFEGAPPLEHLEHWTVEAMRKGGVEPALIYAYEKTDGLLLSVQNEALMPDVDIAQWDAAIDEYETKTGKKAARRRLNEHDLESMLANGPREPERADFVKRLPIAPPFSREEWSTWQLSSIINEPTCFEYFQRCLTEIGRSGRGETYFNMLCVTAAIGDSPREGIDYEAVLRSCRDRKFSADELDYALESLLATCQPKTTLPSAAAAFEMMGFIGSFMTEYAEEAGMEEELSDVLGRINALALMAFAAAVNAELQIQPDAWKR
jgi:hypothetical protein